MPRAILMNGAAATPVGRALYRRRLVRDGYEEEKDSDEYVSGVFFRHWEACGRPTSGAVLELGPGRNVATAQLFAQKGCHPVVCIDAHPYVNRAELGGVEYRAPEAIERTTLPDRSFDVIYSHAVLEHVTDPPAAVRSIARLLRPGGVTTHVVDLRDHRDFDDPHAFLRYPNWLWRMATSRRSWVNRWRASDWRRAFSEARLDIKVFNQERVPLPADQKLARRFARKDTADLETVGILIVAGMPA
jgi:SAM-dependent methyltransferase